MAFILDEWGHVKRENVVMDLEQVRDEYVICNIKFELWCVIIVNVVFTVFGFADG